MIHRISSIMIAGLICCHAASAAESETAKASPVPQSTILRLQEAKDRALRENPSVEAGAKMLEQANLRFKQVITSYYPLVDATLAATHTHLDDTSYAQQQSLVGLVEQQNRSQISLQTNSIVSQLQNWGLNLPGSSLQTLTGLFLANQTSLQQNYMDYRVAFNLRWIIFNGLTREYGSIAAKAAVHEAEAAFWDGKRTLLQAVATSYFSAMLVREQIRVAESDLSFNERMQKEAQLRQDAGEGSRSEVLNFEVLANQDRGQLIQAHQAYQAACNAMAALLGLPDGGLAAGTELEPLTDETPEEMQAPDAQTMITYAVDNRPDLGQKEWTVKRAKATAKAWRGQFFPQVALTATELSSARDGFSFNSSDYSSAVSVGLTQTLFSGGRERLRWEEAKADHAASQYNYEGARMNIASEVRTAVDKLKAAQELLRLQRESAARVEEHRNLAEEGYRGGQIALSLLNEAQRDLTYAQVQLTLALVGLKQAWNDLYHATGQSLERYLTEE